MNKFVMTLIVALIVSLKGSVFAGSPFPPSPHHVAQQIQRHAPPMPPVPVVVNINHERSYGRGYGADCGRKPFFFFNFDTRRLFSGCAPAPCASQRVPVYSPRVCRSEENRATRCTTLHYQMISDDYSQQDFAEVFQQAKREPNPDAVANRILEELQKATIVAKNDSGQVVMAWRWNGNQAVRIGGGSGGQSANTIGLDAPDAPEGSVFDGYESLPVTKSRSGNIRAHGTLRGMQRSGISVYADVRDDAEPFDPFYGR